ncbi:hypothetical protein [Geobacillus subterraneus]|uniref:hypothetical protein n=1 Tax=Geobacillus subterraneus TaxID=129338 RepID=UPI001442BE11|nr:hypothetical protein [Geobacillus subterraneus]QIZ66664.1 hypothetical protein HF500_04910 [Geobacillus subterraneus]
MVSSSMDTMGELQQLFERTTRSKLEEIKNSFFTYREALEFVHYQLREAQWADDLIRHAVWNYVYDLLSQEMKEMPMER